VNTDLAPLVQAASAARSELLSAPPGERPARADALKAAEVALANARADAFARLQDSPARLAPEYVASVVAAGGTIGGGRGGGGGLGFTLPEPIDFNDREGYRSLFDGVSLKGWDGNPKFWRVEGGAIVGESTPQNPSGNSYIAYRDVEARDFTLKFEIKVEGAGGSGLQYRSKTGIPWLAPIAPNVTANVGPVNLNWMMTGPQADFWPNSPYWTGQFYSENTPMRIMAWRGQVVEGAGLGTKRLMGNIGDRDALGKLVRMNDWNQYTVIARGGVLIHILNGQLMAVMVDDDPQSSNNQSGLFGIEIEAVTKVSVRNIWLKKLN
jgi:3-keto-disaccharide hydrolase